MPQDSRWQRLNTVNAIWARLYKHIGGGFPLRLCAAASHLRVGEVTLGTIAAASGVIVTGEICDQSFRLAPSNVDWRHMGSKTAKYATTFVEHFSARMMA